MDCFSRKCEIIFKIKQRPCSPITKRALLCDTEGELLILVDDRIFFDEESILLAEFYQDISFWIAQENIDDFIYESMDYEDSPILRISVHDNLVEISSVWMKENINAPIKIDKKEFINAVKLFINQFESELPEIKTLS